MKEQTYTISLEGMEFHAFHGCHEFERREGGRYTVDFKGVLKGCACTTDALDDTVNYSRIHSIVSVCMAQPSNLIENVAGRILDGILEEFPARFESISIKVSKHNPPIQGQCDKACVELNWKKD